MKYRRFVLAVLLLGVVVILSSAFTVSAQQATTCPALVSSALNQLGTNCANLERNTSCYGFERVQHTAFAESTPADFYTTPGDRSSLTITQTIQTGPFNLAAEQYGLNVMNVEANLPLALPGKGVIYIQTGGVEVENGVEPDEAVDLSGTALNVATTVQTDLLTWPPPSVEGHASTVMSSLPSGAQLIVDAVNPGGDYVRAVYQNSAGWVSLDALGGSVDVAGLPVIGPDSMTPMQDFYFRTGIGGTPCADAPSLLFIQGPNNASVDLTVFDQPIRIESTIILRTLPPGDQLGDRLQLIVLSGLAILYPDSPNPIFVAPGFYTTIGLGPVFVSLGIEGDADEKGTVGRWSQPVRLTQEELDELNFVENFPNNIVNYPVDVPVVTTPSTVGGSGSLLIFSDPSALAAAQVACANGELPTAVCDYLGF